MTVACQPMINLDQWGRGKLIKMALSLLAYFNKLNLAQDAEMLGNAGLANIQKVNQFAHRAGAFAEQIKDSAAHWFGQGFIYSHHGSNIPYWLYSCQVI